MFSLLISAISVWTVTVSQELSLWFLFLFYEPSIHPTQVVLTFSDLPPKLLSFVLWLLSFLMSSLDLFRTLIQLNKSGHRRRISTQGSFPLSGSRKPWEGDSGCSRFSIDCVLCVLTFRRAPQRPTLRCLHRTWVLPDMQRISLSLFWLLSPSLPSTCVLGSVCQSYPRLYSQSPGQCWP